MSSAGLFLVVEFGVFLYCINRRFNRRFNFIFKSPASFCIHRSCMLESCRVVRCCKFVLDSVILVNCSISFDRNYGPLSLAVVTGRPNLANLSLRIRIKDDESVCFVATISGHLVKASTINKKIVFMKDSA
jgi:hypothetical protein